MERVGENLIRVENLSKAYEGKVIFKDLNMHVNHSEVVSVLGISGIGKTTLFNLVTGLEMCDEGRVFAPPDMGYMLQKDLLMPWKNTGENISLPLILKGMDKKEAMEEVTRHLKTFGLEGSQELYPDALSGGMRQRAALLRTWLYSNEIMLLDEPFSSVDAMVKYKLQKWLQGLIQEIDLTILLITHDVREAVLLSDRIYLMTGSPASISDELVLTNKGLHNSPTGELVNKDDAEKLIYSILEKELDRIS